MQGKGKENLACVTIVHERAVGHTLRSGVKHGPSGNAARKLPVDARRLASVSRIHPIDVPAWIDDEVKTNVGRASRPNRDLAWPAP